MDIGKKMVTDIEMALEMNYVLVYFFFLYVRFSVDNFF